MKGLLAKDYALMKHRGRILLFLLAWAIVMAYVMDDSAFTIGWVSMIATITSLTSISYDEYDNGMPFLMSLPVTRKDYAVEKYVFSLICSAVFWLIAVVISIVFGMIKKKAFTMAEDLPGSVLFLAAMMVILAVCIPPMLKWGAEKGRIVMLVMFGVVFVVAFLISRLGGSIKKMAGWLESVSMPAVVLIAIVIGAVLLAASILISIRIMEKKEF